MNTYIQDKLETFEQFLMEKCPCHTNNSPEGFEKWLENLDIDELMDYAMDYRNQSLTDYHNHIVEKIKNSDKAFGIIDKDGKGGAILITDIEKII